MLRAEIVIVERVVDQEERSEERERETETGVAAGVLNHPANGVAWLANKLAPFDVALEPVAAHVNHFWLWQPTKIHVTWYGASPLNFLGWAFVSLLILAFTTPSLIKKQPSGPSTPDFAPFALWLGAIVLFGILSAEARLWLAVITDAVLAGVATFFAIRGAKW